MNHFAKLALWYNARKGLLRFCWEELYRLRREDAEIETPFGRLEGVKINLNSCIVRRCRKVGFFDRQHIRELQQFLFGISHYNVRIPVIIPDGIYGAETAGAIKIFQQEYGLMPTGEVDRYTWDKLADVHREIFINIIRPDAFRKNSLLIPGSAGPVVYLVQVMLNTISDRYDNIPPLGLTGIYDEPTEKSVNMFKEVTGDRNNYEGIDAELWNEIVSAFNKLV